MKKKNLICVSELQTHHFLSLNIFSNDHGNDRFKETHRNPNVIVAQYIGTGNLLGQISAGILIQLQSNGFII